MAGKYRSEKVKLPDGQIFDSRKEHERWCGLRLLERAGKISNLRRQVKFVLIPTQKAYYRRYSDKTGKQLTDGVRVLEQECSYIADFVYTEDGQNIVEDTKGIRTEAYRIKKKLMLYTHGIRIKET